MFRSLLDRLRRGGAKPVVLLVLLLPVVGGGVLAYNLFFNRPGESAIKLIPQDALMVVTLDITPSPQQVPTFKRILEAVKREGLEGELDRVMTQAFDKSPVAAELRPELRESFALAMLDGGSAEPKDEDAVLLLAVKDPGKAAKILAKGGTKSREGGLDVYRLEKADTHAALIGPYVVFSKTPARLSQIDGVHQGKAPALEKSADYQQARASLPEDANLMLFISPAGLKKMAKQTGQVNETAMEATRYLTFGMTVREQGLEMVGQIPTQLAEGSPLKELAQVAAVDPNVLKKLPRGAYGVLALSQPGKYYHPVSQAALNGDQRAQFETELKEVESEMGLSVATDLAPALGGNLVVAVYPDAVDAGKGVEIVGVLDDAHGADPAAVAKKLRAFAERKMKMKFVSEDVNGSTVWGPAQQVAGKTAYVATVGKAVVFSSSRPLLENTLGSFGTEAAGAPGAGSLLAQPSYAGMQQSVVPGAQALLMVDLLQILQSFRPQLEEALKGEKDLRYEDVAGLFGQPNSGLTASGKYDGVSGVFRMHLPLDYDRLVHLIAVGAKKAHGTPGAPAGLQHGGIPEPSSL